MSPPRLRLYLAAGTAGFLGLFFLCKEIPPAAERVLAAAPGDEPASPDVTVVVSREPGVRVAVDGRFELIDSSGRSLPHGNARLDPVPIRASGDGLAVGAVVLPGAHSRIEFRPLGDSVAALSGERLGRVELPGSAVFLRGEDGSVSACARMDVEQYAAAALAARADWRTWSHEALAAQAVALRTTALYRRALARARGEGGEIEDAGIPRAIATGAASSARVRLAVNRTRGVVLAWEGRLFPAPLTRSCGGGTASALGIVTSLPAAPLSGAECPCPSGRVPVPEWRVKVPTERLTARLRPYVQERAIYRLEDVKRLEPARVGPRGRAVRLKVCTAYGDFAVDVLTLMEALGTDVLPAPPAEVREAGPEVIEFAGRGEGPGVGLCQLGSEAMARAGSSFDEIAEHYFPGARLAGLSGLASGGVHGGDAP